MTEWITREQIGLRPRNGGGIALKVANVDGYALHWPGMAKPIDATGAAGQRRVCSALRGWQDYHMDVRGWSDIAYEAAVDQAGRKYTLRGLNIQSGANGNQDVNLRYGAILLVLAPGENPSAAMIATVKEVGGEFCRRYTGARKKPYGHRDVRPRNSQGQQTTDCPGDIAEALILAGKLTPGTTTPPPPDVQGDPEQISISLAACQYTANHNGQYLPNGADDSLNVKAYLVRHGYALPTDSWRTAYAKFQRHLGYDGAAADGIPGKTSLGILCNSANWRLVP